MNCSMNGTVAGNERQVAWISEFSDEDVCTTAELISCGFKNNITDVTEDPFVKKMI